LSTDLTIEQVLMRSVKTAGGLTRGRGIGESQRALWLLSMPSCAEVNQAMQEVTDVGFYTSEQHKEETKARQERDQKDVLSIIDVMKDRSPFAGDANLRNIETGVGADRSVNADNAKGVGDKIIKSMEGKNILDFSFKRKDQVVTMSSKTSIKIDGETVHVDPQLLFQRCTTAANGLFDDISEIFKYELCNFPSSLFDANGFPREAHKSTLADIMWENTVNDDNLPEAQKDTYYVLDGGSLLHRIPWQRGIKFCDIIQTYLNYVQKHYPSATVVFDGYPDGPTTKDVAHIRRTNGINPLKVDFSEDMPCKLKKENFLANRFNKQRFIDMLGSRLRENNYTVVHASDDADVKIVLTAVECAKSRKVTVIGEDTDLLVLLCYHVDLNSCAVYFRSEPKQSTMKMKIWNIQRTKQDIGEEMCLLLPFLHAISGCDTTSRLFGVGKGAAYKKFKSSVYVKDLAQKINSTSAKDEIVQAGEEIIACLYGGVQYEGLDVLRYRKFASKVVTGNIFVQVQTLPPTSDAASLHSSNQSVDRSGR
jgi:hypothetical protein